MMPVSFTQWIKQQAWRDDAVGDLARDIKFDRCWPRWAKGKYQYFSHLRYEHEACNGCQQAFERAYYEWQTLFPGPFEQEKRGLELDWRQTLLGHQVQVALVSINSGSGPEK